ncbi:MAG: hypothetical protein WCQ47_01165 [bacterium]
MIEMLLLIALLVPILTFSVKTLKKGLGKALTSFFTDEIRAQVRYGYSFQEMETQGGITDKDALVNVSGTMPITMNLSSGTNRIYPGQKVDPGWTQ